MHALMFLAAWPPVSILVGIVIGKSIKLADIKAEQARRVQLATELIDDAEAVEQTEFMLGYVMGACVMAGQLDLPMEVWASPERHERRKAKN